MALYAGMMDYTESQHLTAHSVLTVGISSVLSLITDRRISLHPSLLIRSPPGLSKDRRASLPFTQISFFSVKLLSEMTEMCIFIFLSRLLFAFYDKAVVCLFWKATRDHADAYLHLLYI